MGAVKGFGSLVTATVVCAVALSATAVSMATSSAVAAWQLQAHIPGEGYVYSSTNPTGGASA